MNSKSRRKKATLSSWIIFLCAAALLCQGCTAAVKQTDRQTGAAEKTDEKLSVVTTIFPQSDFVRAIAGEEVELKMLLKYIPYMKSTNMSGLLLRMRYRLWRRSKKSS